MKKKIIGTVILVAIAGILGYLFFTNKNLSLKFSHKTTLQPNQKIQYSYVLNCNGIIQSGETTEYIYKTPLRLKNNYTKLHLGTNNIKTKPQQFQKFYNKKLEYPISTAVLEKIKGKITMGDTLKVGGKNGIITKIESNKAIVNLNPIWMIYPCKIKLEIKKILDK